MATTMKIMTVRIAMTTSGVTNQSAHRQTVSTDPGDFDLSTDACPATADSGDLLRENFLWAASI